MLDGKVPGGSPGYAAGVVARWGLRSTIPKLLGLLESPEWSDRVGADNALRVFADRPEGVGYDDRNPNPTPWHVWWHRLSP
jgi:hypothetical protein